MAAERPPCSIVLEGGVTSAVIYASLLAHLSGSYKFKELGGTSSGAVAAAAAAAAEYGRSLAAERSSTAFEGLAVFPDQLAQTDHRGQTALYGLFQPKPQGLDSFRVAMDALFRSGADTLRTSAARVALSLAKNFSIPALVLALAAVPLGASVAHWLNSGLRCFPGIDSLLACVSLWTVMMLPIALGLWLVLAGWAVWVTVRALRENHWGLCNGMTQPDCSRAALTPTLHGLLQTLAGLPEGPPLTFGHLWWGPLVDGSHEKSAKRHIDLQIITTAVSLQRPVRLPGEPDDNPLREFFYDPQEWKDLFPSDVMTHLRAYARPVRLPRDKAADLWALPEPQHWPVLMAVRFSLSFPLLLSALPMYVAVARRDVLRAGDAATQLPFEVRRVYFSDGGITSNCPVHLFDAPLPRFPTFGVNLYTLPRGGPTPVPDSDCCSELLGAGLDAPRHRVSRSDTRDPELDAPRPSAGPSAASPLPFLLDILWTALNWRDSLQRRLPGFRERMVHVGLPPDAGGLHLAMKPATIWMLAQLGVCAARRLERDFSTPRTAGQANAWERHRWTRARTSLSALRQHLNDFVSRLDAGSPRYDDLLRTATPAAHPFDGDGARAQAMELVDRSRELMRTLDQIKPADAVDRDTPEPKPELHMSPPW